VRFGKGFGVMKKPIISYRVATYSTTGFVAAAVILTCTFFASGSVVPLQVGPVTDSSENKIVSEPSIFHDLVNEQELIALLMKDVVISLKPVPKKGWKRVKMCVTGYCPCRQCCGEFSDGITANNHRILWGDTFVAADKSYPFGTKMVIPGYNSDKTVLVMDRGGAIKGNHLDLLFHTHQEALEWGVQYLDVLVKTK
jgi:3D (Asp-Asp-Asp) domain-containing protein